MQLKAIRSAMSEPISKTPNNPKFKFSKKANYFLMDLLKITKTQFQFRSISSQTHSHGTKRQHEMKSINTHQLKITDLKAKFTQNETNPESKRQLSTRNTPQNRETEGEGDRESLSRGKIGALGVLWSPPQAVRQSSSLRPEFIGKCGWPSQSP